MGSFSWTRAEATTNRSNICEGDRYKILVPEEFGGGYISDTYMDYGYVFWHPDGYSKYIDGKGNVLYGVQVETADLYGILAYWNDCNDMDYFGKKYPKTMLDILIRGKTTQQENRVKGIKIGCYDRQIEQLKYPLKLVSESYKGTYEDCKGISYGDPNQGFFPAYWKGEYKEYLERLNKKEKVCVLIGRPINGVTINGFEYVLNENGEPMKWHSEKAARLFLKDHGISEKDIKKQGIEFITEEE